MAGDSAPCFEFGEVGEDRAWPGHGEGIWIEEKKRASGQEAKDSDTEEIRSGG